MAAAEAVTVVEATAEPLAQGVATRVVAVATQQEVEAQGAVAAKVAVGDDPPDRQCADRQRSLGLGRLDA
jgi:hypothetical protein